MGLPKILSAAGTALSVLGSSLILRAKNVGTMVSTEGRLNSGMSQQAAWWGAHPKNISMVTMATVSSITVFGLG